MITKDEQSKLRSTIALLSSMINGEEQHSEQSRKEVSEALSIVNNLPIQRVSNQRELFDKFYSWLDGLTQEEYDDMSLTDKCERFFFKI